MDAIILSLLIVANVCNYFNNCCFMQYYLRYFAIYNYFIGI